MLKTTPSESTSKKRTSTGAGTVRLTAEGHRHAGSRTATHSTWWVIGNASKARTDRTVKPACRA